jgi:hypothetical protein
MVIANLEQRALESSPKLKYLKSTSYAWQKNHACINSTLGVTHVCITCFSLVEFRVDATMSKERHFFMWKGFWNGGRNKTLTSAKKKYWFCHIQPTNTETAVPVRFTTVSANAVDKMSFEITTCPKQDTPQSFRHE